MTFFAILLSLVAERIWPALRGLRSFKWFHGYLSWIREVLGERRWEGPSGVAAALIPPVFAVAFAVHLLGAVWGVFEFGLLAAVLFFCLGPKDLDDEVESFLDAVDGGNEDKANYYAAEVAGGPAPRDPGQRLRAVIEAIFVQSHERWLGVIFWFMVLGAPGAVLYRLACQLKERAASEPVTGGLSAAAERLHGALAWVPVRLAVMGYALTGGFTDTLRAWRDHSYQWAGNWCVSAHHALVAAGFGALQLDGETALDEEGAPLEPAHVRAALALVWRTLIFVVAMVALVTLAGWLL